MIPVDKLKALGLFKEEPSVSLERLAGNLNERRFQADEVILREGEEGQALFVIAQGSVRAEVKADEARERTTVIARLEAGEFFGELSFFERKPMSATIVANEPTTVYLWPREAMTELVKRDGAAALQCVLFFFLSLGTKLRRTTTALVTVLEVARFMSEEKPLQERMASVLGQMRHVLGESSTAAFYKWNIFNDEYDLLVSLPASVSAALPLNRPAGTAGVMAGSEIVSLLATGQTREGLFVYTIGAPGFDSGSKQIIETISAVVAPFLATARQRDEDDAKKAFDRRRHEGITI